MVNGKEKKPNISDAISKELGGGIKTLGKDKAKALIILTLFVFAIIFFIIPFLIGMGYELAINPSWIIGALLAIAVVYMGGSK
jgi:VIT1/CCC1 family predicted Fe2+/Mn2+ transporter